MNLSTSLYQPTTLHHHLANFTTFDVSQTLHNNNTNNFTGNNVAKEITTFGIIKASCVGILIVTAIFGNLLVCISFSLFRNLRSLTNYFIVSLSIADLLSAFLVMPMWCGNQLFNGLWPSFHDQPYLSKYWATTDLFLSAAGIFSLSAISVERNLAITNPFCYTKWLSPSRVFLAITILWVFALSFSLIVAFGLLKGRSLALFIGSIAYIAPFVVLFTMYAKIFIVARRQARRLRQDGAFVTDLKAMKTIAIVVGAYIVCYTPNFVIILWAHFRWKPYVSLDTLTVARWLTYLNSTLNPIIYSCFNKTYRKAFKRLFENLRRKMRGHRLDSSRKISAPTRTTMQSRTSLNTAIRSSAGSLLDGVKMGNDVIIANRFYQAPLNPALPKVPECENEKNEEKQEIAETSQ